MNLFLLNLLTFSKGYRTYCIAAIGAAYIFGVGLGWWPFDEKFLALLGFSGLGFMRAGVKADIASVLDTSSPSAATASARPESSAGRTVQVLALGVFLTAQMGCTAVAPGHDPVVVRAEQTARAADLTLDTFFQWELKNRAAVPPEVTDAADRLRAIAPDALRTARRMTKAYKASRTEGSKADLFTALAVLDQAVAEASRWMQTTTIP